LSGKGCKSYYHTVPGRLRVRIAGLKGCDEAARSLEILLRSIPGTTYVHASPLTGSVLVKFDERALSHDDIVGALEDLGYLPEISERCEELAPNRLHDIGFTIGVGIARAALKQALRRSAASIILELL
jgi:copper chaperone CopZ